MQSTRLHGQSDQVTIVRRQIVGPSGWQDLKVATINFENDALRQCGVPLSGPLPTPTQPLITCLGQAYMQHRAAWLSGLAGAALFSLRHGLGVDAVTFGQGPQARLTMLYRSTDCRRHGASGP